MSTIPSRGQRVSSMPGSQPISSDRFLDLYVFYRANSRTLGLLAGLFRDVAMMQSWFGSSSGKWSDVLALGANQIGALGQPGIEVQRLAQDFLCRGVAAHSDKG